MGIHCSLCGRTPLDCECLNQYSRQEGKFIVFCLIVFVAAAIFSYLSQSI